jgi:hypothetical protein
MHWKAFIETVQLMLQNLTRLIRRPADWNQGDQIGRIFALWAIFYFGQFFENIISGPNCCYIWATFFNRSTWIKNFLDKIWLGLHFGQFFNKIIWSPWLKRKKPCRVLPWAWRRGWGDWVGVACHVTARGGADGFLGFLYLNFRACAWGGRKHNCCSWDSGDS